MPWHVWSWWAIVVRWGFMPRRDLIRNGDTTKTVLIVLAVLAWVTLALAVRVVKQYELGVLFRFGRLRGTCSPGLRIIIPVVDVLHRVSLRIVTIPIQSQGIITRDNVSVD
jgi:regulator of protease activity HflC (stomatin/prohibitin superfamily)